MIVSGENVVKFVSEKTNATFKECAAIGIEKDGAIIAGVVFDEWNGANANITVASDGSRKWLNRHFLLAVFDYAFNVLKAKRLTALIAEFNKDSMRFCRHIGFTPEATLTDAHPSGDLYVYRLMRDECKWRNHV